MKRKKILLACMGLLITLLIGCSNKNRSAKNSFVCDTTLFAIYDHEPCGFSVCYPKNWESQPPNRTIAFEVIKPGHGKTEDSITSMSVLTNFTQNGYTIGMGNFKEYIDSSRKQILRDIKDVIFIKDEDTTYRGYEAHWFDFYGRLIYRKDTLRITQLSIDAKDKDLQYVLTFMRNKGTEKMYKKEEEAFFTSFKESKKCN